MESRAYNGFVVVVRAVAPIPERLIRTVLVAISADDKKEPLASLYSTVEFRTDEDAVAHGFKMAEEWIQSRYQVSDKTGSAKERGCYGKLVTRG